MATTAMVVLARGSLRATSAGSCAEVGAVVAHGERQAVRVAAAGRRTRLFCSSAQAQNCGMSPMVV